MSAWVIIPSAGTGERFGGSVPKPLVLLAGKPVVLHTLEAFEAAEGIEGVVLVGHQDLLNVYRDLIRQAGLKKVRAIVEGGATRSASVRSGLRALLPEVNIVLVHDAARPLVTRRMIDDGIAEAIRTGAAVAAVALKSTVKSADPATLEVTGTPDRALLWEVQTPQAFDRSLLCQAYAGDGVATDDAALVEKLGRPVTLYPGDYRNIKVTTPEDVVVAEALLKTKD